MSSRLNRAEQVERNRKLLLEGARRVFLDRGYAAATLDAIAEDAGFSKGVIYSQFASKADLFLALLEQRIADRAAENEAIVLSGRDGVAAVIELGRADFEREATWATLLVEFRAYAARDPAVNARYAQLHEQSVSRLQAILRRLCEDAGVELPHPPRLMAQFVMAFSAGFTLERAVDPTSLEGPGMTEALLRALGF